MNRMVILKTVIPRFILKDAKIFSVFLLDNTILFIFVLIKINKDDVAAIGIHCGRG